MSRNSQWNHPVVKELNKPRKKEQRMAGAFHNFSVKLCIWFYRWQIFFMISTNNFINNFYWSLECSWYTQITKHTVNKSHRLSLSPSSPAPITRVAQALFIPPVTSALLKCATGSSDSKESACSAGDLGSVLGWRRSPGEGNSNPLQCTCLENPMDRGAWRATVRGVAKIQTRLSD